MSSFKVGDVVEVVMTIDDVGRQYIGHVGRIIGISTFSDCWRIEGAERDTDGVELGFLSAELRLKHPPTYDGNQHGDWSLCPWRPSRVVDTTAAGSTP